MFTTLRRLSLFSYTFLLMNLAAVAGLFHFLRGSSGSWDSGEYWRIGGETDSGAVDWAGFSEHSRAQLRELPVPLDTRSTGTRGTRPGNNGEA
jgi:hypothetical protein